MANTNNFLKSISADNTVRDYKHASKTFVDSNYKLAPRVGNLFHVVFEFTTEAVNLLDSLDKLELPLLVKSADLPQFTIQSETHNAYNRTVYSQQKINYTPINVTFHDDQSDLIRSLWNTYYQFYFNDSKYLETDSAYNTDNRYAERPGKSWGMQNGNVKFFRSIKIYSMFQQRFAEYTLINPSIIAFNHDTHSYQNSQMLQHVVQFNYEAVKYARGYVNNINPRGFGDLRYDTEKSSLGTLGNNNNLKWNGNDLVDTANSALQDLASGNYLGAIGSGINIFDNFKNIDLGGVVSTGFENIASSWLRGAANGNSTVFPQLKSSKVITNSSIQNSTLNTVIDRSNNNNSVISSNGTIISTTEFGKPIHADNIDYGSATTKPNAIYNKTSGRTMSDYTTTPFQSTATNTIPKKIIQMRDRAESLTQQLNTLSTNPTTDNQQQRDLLLREINGLHKRANELQ